MTTEFIEKIHQIPGATQMVEQRDGYWMEAPLLDVVQMAGSMNELGARLSTMTATVMQNDEIEVIYHFYLGHQAFNFKVAMKKDTLPSISSVLPAADWIEREIQDLYRVKFQHHPHPARLIRPEQMESGLFREPGGKANKERK